MKLSPHARKIVLAPFLGALLLFCAPPLHAQSGALFGVVLDGRDGSPVVGAQVSVVGGGSHTIAGSDGVFLLTDLVLGAVQLRVERPGYSTSVEQMDISADSLAALEVRLVPIAVMLDELLVTARKRATANGSSVAEVRPGRSTNLTAADLLARVPNLSMAPDHGQLGKGAGISIRGASTMTQSQAPAIYLDGIRINDYTTPNTPDGPKALSVLAQIPASDVLRIRVLRGASAEARYGDSSNGVILIETNREVQGR